MPFVWLLLALLMAISAYAYVLRALSRAGLSKMYVLTYLWMTRLPLGDVFISFIFFGIGFGFVIIGAAVK